MRARQPAKSPERVHPETWGALRRIMRHLAHLRIETTHLWASRKQITFDASIKRGRIQQAMRWAMDRLLVDTLKEEMGDGNMKVSYRINPAGMEWLAKDTQRQQEAAAAAQRHLTEVVQRKVSKE